MKYSSVSSHNRVVEEQDVLVRAVQHPSNWYPSGSMKRHLGSEFIGSLLWQFLCSGSAYNAVDQTVMGAAWSSHHGTSQSLIMSLGAGLSYTVLLFACSGDQCSGGRLNPLISTSLFVARKIKIATFALELVAQFSGSFLGALLLQLCLPPSFKAYAPDEPVRHMEHIVTFGALFSISFWHFASCGFLVLVYFATCVDFQNQTHTRDFWPLCVGLCMVAASLGGGPDAGGAMDPAGSVALAIIRWDLRNLWAFLLASFLGAILAGFVYSRFLQQGVSGPPLACGAVFEGVRQQTEEFHTQSFMVYLVVDTIAQDWSESNEWTFSGRLCYPDLGDAVADIHGTVTQDGKVMKYAEPGGPFAGSTFQGRMPDSRHVIGMQMHENHVPLSHLCLVITPAAFQQSFIEQLNQLPAAT